MTKYETETILKEYQTALQIIKNNLDSFDNVDSLVNYLRKLHLHAGICCVYVNLYNEVCLGHKSFLYMFEKRKEKREGHFNYWLGIVPCLATTKEQVVHSLEVRVKALEFLLKEYFNAPWYKRLYIQLTTRS